MKDIKSAIIFDQNFFEPSPDLFDFVVDNISWNDKMLARKTASFGQHNVYSDNPMPLEPLHSFMLELSVLLEPIIGFKPNNCFLNYYENGTSKMGWHGDSTHFLEENTGTAILSIGDTRIFQLRRNAVPTELLNYVLKPGSLIYMPTAIQKDWQHAIPKVVSERGRISMTFRKMKLDQTSL
jgi:alkylated DNA repair dioxygenase AlkB